MKSLLHDLRAALVSLHLTLFLLALSLILVFAATLDQTHLGIWGIQEKWFRSFVVMQDFQGLRFPAFPGGYTVGGLLLANLVAAHLTRFRWEWSSLGQHCTHGGLILLLVGELLSGLYQEDYLLRLGIGETRTYAESQTDYEVAFVDRSDPLEDQVVAVPLAALEGEALLRSPDLPFSLQAKGVYRNSRILPGRPASDTPQATLGLGTRLRAESLPVTHRPNETNLPSVVLDLVPDEGTLGTLLVSAGFAEAQAITHAGRTWHVELRPRRLYRPVALTLLEFTHEKYPGTDIPKAFRSRLRLQEAGASESREVRISMNQPLRHGGLTYYQAGYENNEQTSVFHVVRNSTWFLPYLACGLMTLGMLWHFSLKLWQARSGAAASPAP